MQKVKAISFDKLYGPTNICKRCKMHHCEVLIVEYWSRAMGKCGFGAYADNEGLRCPLTES